MFNHPLKPQLRELSLAALMTKSRLQRHPHLQAVFRCSKVAPAIVAGQLLNVLRHFLEMGQYETKIAIIFLNRYREETYRF